MRRRDGRARRRNLVAAPLEPFEPVWQECGDPRRGRCGAVLPAAMTLVAVGALEVASGGGPAADDVHHDPAAVVVT